MLAEITESGKWLVLFEEKEPQIIRKRYEILAREPEQDGYWLFFTDGTGDPIKILAAFVTLHEDGSLASIRWNLDKRQWHRLHQLWNEKKDQRTGPQ